MDAWKQRLLAPYAAAIELLVAGLAQWVCFVCDRWQYKSSVRKLNHIRVMKIEICTREIWARLLNIGRFRPFIGHEGRVEVYLYSIFDLGTRRG